MNKKLLAAVAAVGLTLSLGVTASAGGGPASSPELDYPVTKWNHIDQREFGGQHNIYVFCHGPDLVYTIPSGTSNAISVIGNDERCK